MNFVEQQEFLEEKLLSPRAKKSRNARRWKQDREDVYRTAYQRDVGRILYSDAFRRLRMKTQVFMARGVDQHSRTRLTHTLEVSQMAKSIARPLELNLDLTEAIALGHDLGHTPFGHAGEKALQTCLKPIGLSFHHNVQSVWIVQTALANREDVDGNHYPGFNLTYDVVEGIWKHTKFVDTVDEFSRSLSCLNPNAKGSLEAQIVDKADSIAYIFHDIKDAERHKIITYDEFKNDVWDVHFDLDFNEGSWINIFIHDLIENNRDTEEINFSEDVKKAFEDIKEYIYDRVIKSPKVAEFDQESEEKICTIYDYYKSYPELILSKYGEGNRYKHEKYGVERMLIDYIQWLGDENANMEYEKIFRIRE